MTRLAPDVLPARDVYPTLVSDNTPGFLAQEMERWWMVVHESDVPGYRYLLETEVEQPPGSGNIVWACDFDDDVLLRSYHSATTRVRRFAELWRDRYPDGFIHPHLAVVNLLDHMRDRGLEPRREIGVGMIPACKPGSRVARSWPYA